MIISIEESRSLGILSYTFEAPLLPTQLLFIQSHGSYAVIDHSLPYLFSLRISTILVNEYPSAMLPQESSVELLRRHSHGLNTPHRSRE